MQRVYQLSGVKIDSAQSEAQFRAAFHDGFKTIVPTAPATLIWAIVTAVAMVSAGMSPFYVLLTNALVYAASAQLAVLSMLMVQAPLPIIWLAAAAVNLRFVIFSAGLQPFFRHLNLPRRLFYGFFNGDIISMLFGFRYRNETPHAITVEQSGFYLGLALFNYVGWQLGCVIGVLFASFIPASWGLDLAASLTLLALIIKGVNHWAGIVGCVVSAMTAVWLQAMPFKLWLPLAIVFGVIGALLVEFKWPNAFLKPQHKGDDA